MQAEAPASLEDANRIMQHNAAELSQWGPLGENNRPARIHMRHLSAVASAMAAAASIGQGLGQGRARGRGQGESVNVGRTATQGTADPAGRGQADDPVMRCSVM